MSSEFDELVEKKLSILIALKNATISGKLLWRHIDNDSFETNYRSLGFNLDWDDNKNMAILEISKLMPSGTWWIIMRYYASSIQIEGSQGAIIMDIWSYLRSEFESKQADEVLETLTQI
ncbi:MAG: hypothetical protein FJY65_06300 [Calditrichaeota bacterium]|nr:hypothetical protein [Calditrichota bacterium]